MKIFTVAIFGSVEIATQTNIDVYLMCDCGQ